jgi:tRNA U38,U39,U40 pseudouridine synthase TruA
VSLTGENARPSDLVGASNTCPEAVSQRASLHRLWAKVEYDGTDFFGFQVQAVERTIQGEIERALEAITGVETRVRGAGRTDRGVHARGQVIGFEVRWKHSLRELQRALNAILAADVAIVEMGVASQGFHPRFDALSRTYRYTLLTSGPAEGVARRAVARCRTDGSGQWLPGRLSRLWGVRAAATGPKLCQTGAPGRVERSAAVSGVRYRGQRLSVSHGAEHCGHARACRKWTGVRRRV